MSTSPTAPRPLVTACRGCCCGTSRTHPAVDHDALLRRLVDAVGDRGRVRTGECLGPCSRSNFDVIAPVPAARRRGARPAWVRAVLDDATVDDIAVWVAAGGPGVAAPPRRLELLTFRPGTG